MHTYLPTDLTIKEYLRDYLFRLGLDRETEECRARISNITWVPLGASGRILLKKLTEVLPERSRGYIRESSVLTATYNRKTKQASFSGVPPESSVISKRLENREAIVLDSSVHSGGSMLAACQLVQKHKPRVLSTYTFCLKRGAKFVPNYFALLIHDWDRALFWLEAIPDNRLAKDIHNKNVQVRRIETKCDFDDLDRKDILDNGKDIIASPEEEHPNSLCHNYVCSQDNTVRGWLTFQWVSNEKQENGCRICRIRATSAMKGLEVTSLLLRWTDTCARHNCCNFVELLCPDTEIRNGLMEMGFKPVENSSFLRREIIPLTKIPSIFSDHDRQGNIF